MFSFLTILLNCAIMGPIERVKIKSTLKPKVKTRAKKRHFSGM